MVHYIDGDDDDVTCSCSFIDCLNSLSSSSPIIMIVAPNRVDGKHVERSASSFDGDDNIIVRAIQPSNRCSKEMYGYVVVLLGVTVLTLDTLLIRLASRKGASIWLVASCRYGFFFCSTFAVAIVRQRGLLTALRQLQSIGKLGFGAACMFSVNSMCFTLSVYFTSAANTLVIVAASPMLSAAISKFYFKKQIPWWTLVAMVICFGSVVVVFSSSIVSEEDDLESSHAMLGVFLALICSVMLACYFNALHHSSEVYPGRNPSMILVPTVSAFMTTAVASIVMFASGQSATSVDASEMGWLILQGAFVLPVSFIALTIGPRYISATETNLFMLLETVMGPLWVALAGFEKPPKLTIFACALLVTALLFNSSMTLKKRRTSIRRARAKDAEAIFTVVNEAYAVEKGDSGIAFKDADRYPSIEGVQRDIRTKAGFFVYELGGRVVGCIVSTINDDGCCFFGPFAVDANFQNRGIASKLLKHMYQWCRQQGVMTVRIEVVNHRTDLFLPPENGFYGKRGYSYVATEPCDAERMKCTRESSFLILEKNIDL